MRHLSIYKAPLFFGWIIVLFVCSCRQLAKTTQVAEKKHQVEIGLKGIGMMYLDRVPNESIMKNDSTNNAEYYCFQVGFIDSSLSISPDKEKGKYFQYDMYRDWMAIVNHDSIVPVYFHSKIKITRQQDEGILVFEVAKGERPDALVYRDSHGPWGVQKIILNN